MQTRTDLAAREEAIRITPPEVLEELERAGFTPTWDAGNLWFFDRGPLRLLCGEDGTEIPENLAEEVELTDMRDLGDDPEIVWSGPVALLPKAHALGVLDKLSV